MRRGFNYRPAPAASGVAVVVGLAMLIGGLAFISQAPTAPAPVMIFFGFWILLVVAAVIYHLINSVAGGGVPGQVADETLPPELGGTQQAWLDALRGMREAGLISEAEYARKRQEILRE